MRQENLFTVFFPSKFVFWTKTFRVRIISCKTDFSQRTIGILTSKLICPLYSYDNSISFEVKIPIVSWKKQFYGWWLWRKMRFFKTKISRQNHQPQNWFSQETIGILTSKLIPLLLCLIRQMSFEVKIPIVSWEKSVLRLMIMTRNAFFRKTKVENKKTKCEEIEQQVFP